MSRYRRVRTPGAAYFFTVNTYRRQRLLTDSEVLCALREAMRLIRAERPFQIDPTMRTIPLDGACSSAMYPSARHRLGEPQAASRHRRGELGLWQRRFWEHQIRDDADYTRHVDYTHYNPVNHGLVRRACDWPQSTFHRFVRLGLYPPDWAGGGIEDPRDEFGELEE